MHCTSDESEASSMPMEKHYLGACQRAGHPSPHAFMRFVPVDSDICLQVKEDISTFGSNDEDCLDIELDADDTKREIIVKN